MNEIYFSLPRALPSENHSGNRLFLRCKKANNKALDKIRRRRKSRPKFLGWCFRLFITRTISLRSSTLCVHTTNHLKQKKCLHNFSQLETAHDQTFLLNIFILFSFRHDGAIFMLSRAKELKNFIPHAVPTHFLKRFSVFHHQLSCRESVSSASQH